MTREEKESLILNNRGIAGLIAKKAYNISYVRKAFGSFEDVYQVGMVALCKAAEHFDPTRLAKSGPRKGLPVVFGSYAGKAIWNEITRTSCLVSKIRLPAGLNSSKTPKHIRELALKASVIERLDHTEAAESIYDNSEYYNPVDEACFNEYRSKIKEHINNLTERQCKTIKSCFGIEVEQIPVSRLNKEFKISRQRIQQIKDDALKILRKKFIASGIRKGEI